MNDWGSFFFVMFIVAIPFWYCVFLCIMGLIVTWIEKVYLNMKGK